MTRLGAVVMLVACVSATWAAGPPDGEAWERFGKLEEAERLNLRGMAL